ncbi:MAG: hypothetical protein IMF08_08635 [Proteobacteria bacterium]|nr:hypothetical protein [Pseudomonadota bacterium]
MKNMLSLCRVPLAMLSVALVLSACIPDSRNPLPSSADGEGDDRLIGRWFSGNEGEEYADVAAAAGDRYKVRMVSINEGGPSDSPGMSEFDILATRIGENRYMTIVGFDELKERGPDNPLHMILRYEITDGGQLLIWIMNLEAVGEDVHADRIAGQVIRRNEIRLTADSAALAAYIASSDVARIFAGDPLPMRRP